MNVGVVGRTAVVLAASILAALIVAPALASESRGTNRVVYAGSAENFPNPERGFFIQRVLYGWPYGPSDTLTPDDLYAARRQGTTLVRAYYLIGEFRGGPLPRAFLDGFSRDLATARASGAKMVPLFAYTWGEDDPVNGGRDAPVGRALGHLDQLEPVIRANSDVIAFWDPGFIGHWGEWHSSTNDLLAADGSMNANSRAIMRKLLDVVPRDRMLSLRYVGHKQQFLRESTPLAPPEAFGGTAAARIGAKNDCFLASNDDWGTYTPGRIQQQKAYLHADNRYLPQGGETCNPNPPRSECPTALRELAYMRWSTINEGYHPSVLRSWREGGCMPRIERALGYRFRLTEATVPKNVTPGGPFPLAFTVKNDGFASPYNPRPVEVVLRNRDTRRETRLRVGADPRFWLPGPARTVRYAGSVPPSLAPGVYDLFLRLPAPEPRLRGRPAYSVRLANDGLWEPKTGYNRLKASVRVVGR